MARDSDAGLEVLLVKRRAGYAFGNAYAFPGGVIDPDVEVPRLPWDSPRDNLCTPTPVSIKGFYECFS